MRKPGIIVLLILLTGCATYYRKNLVFQEHFVSGRLEQANEVLDKNKKASKNKDRLLYFLQKGVVLQVLGDYQQSNEYFEKAYFFTEDYQKNHATELTSLLVNPGIRPYTGEDHELVLMHYFKTLNFLRMEQYESALVECRRINNKLNALNQRYDQRKNRYQNDAFALNLMGITYEATGDNNNAFIAYRNAYQAYKDDYASHYQLQVPEQLKKDLLRAAHKNGFREELAFFENEFSMKYQAEPNGAGELIIFWHNGLGPVKDEWSINFFIEKGRDGTVMFVNEEYGLSFPYSGGGANQSNTTLGDLKFVRAAFPKYVERKPYFQRGELLINNKTYPLEMAENINAIAFKTLEDRMLREFAVSLTRLALKQAAEEQTRKQDENLGALLSVVNAVSEKADTRNWQTLPYSISYARVPLKKGVNNVKLKAISTHQNTVEVTEFEFTGNGNTIFHIHNSLESVPLKLNY